MEWYFPVLIFVARIGDVSIGTVRQILLLSGYRYLAALLGIIEVVIWVFAVGGAIRYLPNPWAVAGYAGGYGVGVLVGTAIENRLALGYRMMRVVSRDHDADLAGKLREAGYRVTKVQGHGMTGEVDIAFLVVPRKNVPKVRQVVATIDERAFITVERVERPEGPGFESRTTERRFWMLAQAIRK